VWLLSPLVGVVVVPAVAEVGVVEKTGFPVAVAAAAAVDVTRALSSTSSSRCCC